MATIRSKATKARFEIHHDELAGRNVVDNQDLNMDESRAELEDDDEDQEEDTYSNCSDATDEIVDASVAEDMERFEETFQGMKGRFRLINRIGEGRSCSLLN
jgi:cell division control protein 7